MDLSDLFDVPIPQEPVVVVNVESEDTVFGGVVVQLPAQEPIVVDFSRGGHGQSGYSGYSGPPGQGGSGFGGSSYSGYSGKSGYSGASGKSGYSGYSGSGFSGFSGSGVSGFSGYSGAGLQGESGYSGFSGRSGFSGYSGSGLSGYSGSGHSGFSGYSGVGASGPTGPSGFSGFSGASGISGPGGGNSGYSGYSGNDVANAFKYTFVTLFSPPGLTQITYDNSVFASVTEVLVSRQSSSGLISSWLNALDDYGSPSARGYLTIYEQVNANNYQLFLITGSVIVHSPEQYYEVLVTPVLSTIGTGTFANDTPVFISFTPFGLSGYSGFSGSGISGYSGIGTSGFSGFAGASGRSGYSGYSGYSASGISGYSGAAGGKGDSGTSGYSGYSGSGTSGFSGAGTSGFSGYSGAAGFSGLIAWNQLDRTTTVVSETATLTIAANTKIKSTASGTLTTIAFSGGADATQARRLDLDITGGPYTLTIPVCRRLGETGTVSSIVVEAGYHEFSWEYINSEYVMSDSVGTAVSGFSGYSGKSGYSGPSGFSGYSSPSLLTFSTQTDTDYTLVLGDANTGIKMVSASSHNLTVPTNASVAFAVGTQIVVEQGGAGLVHILGSGGVTMQGADVTTGQYTVLVLIKQATDTWLVAVGGGGGSGAGASGASGYSGFSGANPGASGYSGYSGSGVSGYSGYSGSGISGYSGYSGAGLSGFSGYSSTSGFSGFSGKSGYSGYSGSGISGYSGYSGSGVSGYSGYSGAGLSGFSGYSSASGISGFSGFSGKSGYSGYSGSGVSGYSGYSGSGTSGFSGLSGYSGAGVASIPIGQTLYVDATNGNDGTALRGRFDKPYLTISAANTASVAGDTIKVGPGTFTENSGVQLKANINLIGDGIDVTTIQSSLNLDSTGKCIINPGNNDTIRDLTIYGSDRGGVNSQAALGVGTNDNAASGVTVRNCKFDALSDGFFINNGSTSIGSFNLYDCIINSQYDSARVAGATNAIVQFFNCQLVSNGPFSSAAPAHGVSMALGTARVYGGRVQATNAGASSGGAVAGIASGGTLEAYNVRVTRDATGAAPYDFSNTGGTVKLSNCFREDGAALSNNGTITYLLPVGASGYSGYSGSGISGYSGFSGAGTSGYSGYSGAGTSGYSGYSSTQPGTSGYSGYSGSGISGYSGYSGAGLSGYSGYSGSGLSGYSGYSGSGLSGYSGYSGSGVSGYSGYSGSGLSGYSGYSGSGLSGYSGYSGSGVSGYSGYSGSGISGFSGFSGAGTSGFSGYSGFAGTAGTSGFSGYSGAGTSGYSGYSAPSLLVFSTHTDTDYTLALTDANTGIKMSSSAAHNLTIPLNATVAFDTGTQVVIEQFGTGQVTIVATGGVTLNGVTKTTGQYSVVVLIKTGTDTWLAAQGVSGYSGYSGSGISGYSGFIGVSGFSGYSGAGLSGYSGYSGYSGPSGYSGYSGFSGFSGISGFSAFSGYSGPSASPINSQVGTYSTVLSDAGKTITASGTFTITIDGSLAYPDGTLISFINAGSGTITIGISTDTLNRCDGTAGTGSRTLAPSSMATVIKTATGQWWINGKFAS